MKILYCDTLYYFNIPGTVSMTYEYFAKTLRELGHTVHFFEYPAETAVDRWAMNDFFLSIVKNGCYDLVWITMLEDEFEPEVLDEVKRLAVIMAWNSDDDLRWNNYSSKWYPHFTFMATTCRHIYESYKKTYPNLILSQWGCTGRYDGWNIKKDIDFSFVGQIYSHRKKEIEYIHKNQPIVTYGMGAQPTLKLILKRWAEKKLGIPSSLDSKALTDEAAVKEKWNRSKVSYTPLSAWESGHLQVKARIFDMGLSGTVMLCNVNPALYEFYEPNKEYWEFEDLDECISKTKYLLKHENERQKIASAYYNRTKSDHMWQNRFHKLFNEIGMH